MSGRPSGGVPVPAGMRLVADAGLSVLDDGCTLLGGAPLRLMRLRPAGARAVARWRAGEPVPDRASARRLARRLLDAGLMHPASPEDPASSTSEVTTVIPVHDTPERLARCLAGLTGGGAAVVVVDDGSPDAAGIARVVEAVGARLIRHEVARGPAAARNAGLAAATTRYVAFMDADCVPEKDWLERLLPHFADPAVAAVAPRITAHGRGSGWLARYERDRSALDMGPAPSPVRPGARVPYVPSAAIVLRRDAAGEGFDAAMRVGEDVDLVWRLAAAGWSIRYEPAARVAHEHRIRLGAWLRRRMDYGTSAAPLSLRHPGTLPAVSMSGWSAAAWALAALGHPLLGTALTAAVTARLAHRLTPLTSERPPPLNPGAHTAPATDPATTHDASGAGGRPWWPESAGLAVRLAGAGTVQAGRMLGVAVARGWWPVAVPAAVVFPRIRPAVVAGLLVPPLLDWYERRPALDPVRYTAAQLLDGAAYATGVWRGCLRERTAAPLLPRLWWRSPADAPGGPPPGASSDGAGRPDRGEDPIGDGDHRPARAPGSSRDGAGLT